MLTRVSSGQVVSIDGQMIALDLKTLCANPLQPTKEFQILQEKILEYSSYNIWDNGVTEVQAGFLQVTEMCINADWNDMAQWEVALKQFKPPLVGIENVSREFFLAVVGIMKKILKSGSA